MKRIFLKRSARQAYDFADALATRTPVAASRCRDMIPKLGGVYIVYRGDRVVYVGRADNLNKRICDNHISASRDGHTSTLRELVHLKYGVPYGTDMKRWIQENLSFAYMAVEDRDVRGIVEYLLIAATRTPTLMNRLKG